GLQPGAALTAERDCVRFAGGQTVDQSVGAVRAMPVAVGGYPAMLVNRHVVYLPVCVFTYRFSRPVQDRQAGPRRFRIESQPKKQLTGVLSAGHPGEA